MAQDFQEAGMMDLPGGIRRARLRVHNDGHVEIKLWPRDERYVCTQLALGAFEVRIQLMPESKAGNSS